MKTTDLGIPKSEEVEKAINMAHARLVPKEALDGIRKLRYDALKLIEEKSIPFPLVAGASFVPGNQRDELEEELEKLKTEFQVEVTNFIANYGNYQENMRPVIREAIKTVAVGDPEAGTQRILSMYPTADQVFYKFKFLWRSFAISAPMDGTVSSQFQETSNEVKEAVKTMVEGLRDKAIEKIQSIINLVLNGGKYTAKTTNSAKRIIGQVRKLNILNDQTLETALKEFEFVLDGYDGKGEITGFKTVKDELQKNLNEAVEAATERLMSLGKRKLNI